MASRERLYELWMLYCSKVSEHLRVSCVFPLVFASQVFKSQVFKVVL